MNIHEVEIPTIDCFAMVYPSGIGLDIPFDRAAFRDDTSLSAWPRQGVVDHLFGPAALRSEAAQSPRLTVDEFDLYGIRAGQVVVNEDVAPQVIEAVTEYSDRFFFAVRVNPHQGMRSVRRLEALVARYPSIKSCTLSPHMYYPQVPPSSREYFPIYAKCIELGIPVFINVGFPGPRVPAASQHPMHLDEVCWFFPDLTVVMKHCGEPWADVCVKLMITWPNLFYATSAFAPKYYPKSIVHYANTRGPDRILYAGYYPILGFANIVDQLNELDLRDHVWNAFLHDNATRVFGLT